MGTEIIPDRTSAAGAADCAVCRKQDNPIPTSAPGGPERCFPDGVPSAMLASLLGRRFWITAWVALVLGFVVPGDWQFLRTWAVPICLGAILYFTFLRLPLADLQDGLRDGGRWLAIGWMGLVKLLVLPLAAWGLTGLASPIWAPGILLVALMPAGLSSVAFTDLYRGDRVLALMLVVFTSLLCPLTVPVILAALVPGSVFASGAILERALYILVLLAGPFLLAQLTRRFAAGPVARHQVAWGRAAIASSCVLVLVSVAANRPAWAHLPVVELITPLALASAAGLIFILAARLSVLAVPIPQAVAFACGAVYMNNGLAIAFAARFYPEDAAMILPPILMQVPMVAGVALLGRTWRDDQAPGVEV